MNASAARRSRAGAGSTTTTSGAVASTSSSAASACAGAADDHDSGRRSEQAGRGSPGPGRRHRRRAREAVAASWRAGIGCMCRHRVGCAGTPRNRPSTDVAPSAERRVRPTSSVADGGAPPRRRGGRRRARRSPRRGTTTSIVVPSPGTLRHANAAPILSARARIPARPRWPSGTRVGSKPLPSSLDPQADAAPRSGRPRARTWRAPACLTTLWSASWAIR